MHIYLTWGLISKHQFPISTNTACPFPLLHVHDVHILISTSDRGRDAMEYSVYRGEGWGYSDTTDTIMSNPKGQVQPFCVVSFCFCALFSGGNIFELFPPEPSGFRGLLFSEWMNSFFFWMSHFVETNTLRPLRCSLINRSACIKEIRAGPW